MREGESMDSNFISGMLNNSLRLTGLSSGLDTDSIVKKLMSIEQTRIDKVRQDKQVLEWKQEQYREITNLLRGLYDDYFNTLKPSTNLRSASAFTAFEASSSNTSLFTVKASSGAVLGTHDIVISSVASCAAKTGTSGVSAGFTGFTGDASVDMTAMKQGKQFTINLDGDIKTIVLDNDYTGYSVPDFALALDALADNSFGANKINITGDGITGKLTFSTVISSSNLTISDGSNTYLGSLGLLDGQNNSLAGSSDVTDFSGGNFKIKINAGTVIDISVATGAADIDGLLANINSALDSAGAGSSVQATRDPDNANRVRFVSMNTSEKVTITSGSSDNLLTKVSVSNGATISPLRGTIDFSVSDVGKDFYIKVDNGEPVHIELAVNYTSETSMAMQAAIQNALDVAGITGVTVNIAGGKISFSNTSPHRITIQKGDDGLRDELGFTSIQASKNRIDFTDNLASLSQRLTVPLYFGTDGQLSFTINDISFTFNQSQTLNEVINTINGSSTGVTLKYDSLNDNFILQSKTSGIASVIDNSDDTADGDNFFAALKIKTTAQETGGLPVRGTDASLTINGTLVNRSTNNFSVQGLEFSLKAADPLSAATVSVTANAADLINNIKAFVSKYNEIIGKISSRISEKRDRNYIPLTSEQKSAMKDDEIKLWEDKAKSGLLHGDKTLYDLVYKLRKAFFDPIDGTSITMAKIGISTSAYSIDGKLTVDESRLNAAIADNYDAVVQLFIKDDSDISYNEAINDAERRGTRYGASGVAQRLSDILQDNIRTVRDANGLKGILLEKAGIMSDLSESKNMLTQDITKKDIIINELLIKYNETQERYYKQFAAMETALSQMNSQSAWLSQQLGSNN